MAARVSPSVEWTVLVLSGQKWGISYSEWNSVLIFPERKNFFLSNFWVKNLVQSRLKVSCTWEHSFLKRWVIFSEAKIFKDRSKWCLSICKLNLHQDCEKVAIRLEYSRPGWPRSLSIMIYWLETPVFFLESLSWKGLLKFPWTLTQNFNFSKILTRCEW